jgi:diguanylate cyclase (GGDEF)-like protein
MTLDVWPFWMIGALCATGCGVLVLLVRKGYPDYLGRVLLFLGAANICLGAAFAARLAQAWEGQFVFYVVSSTLVASCLSLEYRGVCELKGQAPSAAWMFGPPLLMFGVCTWLTFVQRNITVEQVVFDLSNLIVMTRIAFLLLRAEEGKRRFVDLLAAASYILLAAANSAVILDFFRVGNFATEYNFNNPRTVFNCMATIVSVGVVFPLFLLMVSERLNRDLIVQAMCDPLTGLYNRRAFEEIAFREMAGVSRTGQALSVLMFDLDDFKQVNDRFGHPAGDAVLRDAAARLRASLRDEDYLGRWGGDEFCALLPRATKQQAQFVAERVIQAFGEFIFAVGGKAMNITVSIGAATQEGEGKDFSWLVKRADDAMYRAKRGSRTGSAFAQDGDPD